MRPEQAKERLKRWELPKEVWPEMLKAGNDGPGSHEVRAIITIARKRNQKDYDLASEVIKWKVKDGIYTKEQLKELVGYIG